MPVVMHAWREGTCLGGMHAWGCVHAWGVCMSPPVNRMTDACENITLPQTSFAGGKNRLAFTLSSFSGFVYKKSNLS